jgi:hypothetical protein
MEKLVILTMSRLGVYSINNSMETSSYASRSNNPFEYKLLEELFTPKEGFKWFIEHYETHLWLCADNTWTNDPHKGLSFDLETQAISGSFKLPIEIKKVIIFTEHEFVK